MKPRRSRKADAITPVGGGEALPERPSRVVISESDQQRAVDEWDRAFDGDPLAGLLNAKVQD